MPRTNSRMNSRLSSMNANSFAFSSSNNLERPSLKLQKLPEDFDMHVQFLLWPREKIELQLRPHKRQIIQNFKRFNALLLLIFVYIPVVSIGYTIYNFIKDVDVVSVYPLFFGIALEIPLVFLLFCIYRGLDCVYVMTDQRLLLIRQSYFPCTSTLVTHECQHQEIDQQYGYNITTFKQGYAILKVRLPKNVQKGVGTVQKKAITFRYCRDAIRLERVIRRNLSPPVFKVEKNSCCSFFVVWAFPLLIALLCCLLFTILPSISIDVITDSIHKAAYGSSFSAFHSVASSTTAVVVTAASTNSNSVANSLPFNIDFYNIDGALLITNASVFSICFIASIITIVYSLKGMESLSVLRSHSEQEMHSTSTLYDDDDGDDDDDAEYMHAEVDLNDADDDEEV